VVKKQSNYCSHTVDLANQGRNYITVKIVKGMHAQWNQRSRVERMRIRMILMIRMRKLVIDDKTKKALPASLHNFTSFLTINSR
jgi:hypothetical protein